MDTFIDLEFDKILDSLAGLATAEPVKQAIKNIAPQTELSDVQKCLTQTGDAIAVLASHKPDLFFYDILPYLNKARVGASLSPAELLHIRRSILALRSLKKCVESADGYYSLGAITSFARVCDELEYEISRCVESESALKDSASDKLFSLRKAVLRANSRLKEKLDSYTHQSEMSKYLQDNIVTLRGGRYVLPVRSECRSSVKGLVHDVSSSGATVFIEPFAIVDANNELITLKTEEANEVERILAELTQKTVACSDALARGQEVLTDCGVIFAKAEYALKHDCYCPVLNTEGIINLVGARHPLIEREKVVPVDIALNGKKILLISGPNTGGKTVALKTVGLFALMAASGMFLPAQEGSEISVFDAIYCDIGDSQSIAMSLSTFSAHIVKLTQITSSINARSLVLLDEVGDGTDPEEGAALAVAVIKKLLRAGSTAVVTTHFNSVKQFGMTCDGVANACMQFDNENLTPTFRLLNGVSGASYALEIAERLGLGADMIADARASLSEEKVAFDTVMRQAELLRNRAAEDRAITQKLREDTAADAIKAQKLRDDYQKKLSEINDKSKELVRKAAEDYTKQAEDIIQEIKAQLQNADDAALFVARKSAKKLRDSAPSDEPIVFSKKSTPAEQPVVGDHVYVSGVNKEGVIVSIHKGAKALVAIGSVKTELPLSALTQIEVRSTKAHTVAQKTRTEPENREIMLLGYTVDDATAMLDRILSDITPQSTIRVVHGKGTGALGKGIQSYLKKHPRVKSFRYGRYGEGDTGVTIVEIK